MSDNAQAVGSITVNQAAQSFASMLDSQEGVDTGAEAQPEEEQSESESEEMESAEPQDEAEETSEEVEGEEEEAEEEAPRDEKFVVKVDGKEIEVPKDELIRGYQRESLIPASCNILVKVLVYCGIVTTGLLGPVSLISIS